MPERRLAIAIALILSTGQALAAELTEASAGVPFTRNYGHREYAAHPQNWAIVQDSRGVMYFGNSGGVLEFDGGHWRLIPVDNHSIVRSLAVDQAGTLFVGAVGELGCLRSDGRGELAYQSLVSELPAREQDFQDVWRTFAVGESVFFWWPGKLLRWRDAVFRTWEIEDHLVPAVVDGKLYVNLLDAGLRVLAGDTFVPVPGGEALAQIRVDVVLPAGDESLLIGSRDGRLFRLRVSDRDAPSEARRLVGFATEAEDYLARHLLYTGTRLRDGAYVLTTMNGGAVVIGPRGDLRDLFDRSNGLPDVSVWAAYEDRENGLWLGMNRGLGRIEIASPIRAFGETAGIDGTVEAIARHRGELYVATGTGVFMQVGQRFEAFPVPVGPCWSLLSHELSDSLLVGCAAGVYEIAGDRVRHLRRTRNAFSLYRSPQRPSLTFAGEGSGLGVLRFEGGRWTDQGSLDGIHDEIRSLFQDAAGRLWLATHFNGVLRLDLASGDLVSAERIARFGTAEGLPARNGIRLCSVDGELIFAASNGLWRFDPATKRFSPSPLFGPRFGDDDQGIQRLSADPHGNLWLSQTQMRGPAHAVRQLDGTFEVDDRPYRPLPKGHWYAILPEPDGMVWLGGTEGLYRFDATVPVELDRGFTTLLRSVEAVSATAQTELFGFDRPSGTAIAQEPLPFASNSLTFHFSAASFGNENQIVYRFQLEGYDDAWSPWVRDIKKEYTNLSEGDYRFRVQGKNVYGSLGDEASYIFRIQPPWYRTAGFRLAAFVAAASLLWTVHRGLISRFGRIQKELSERDRAVERERLIKLLKQQNAELESFSYTVSHDLKSPLLTIKGFLGLLRQDLAAGETERAHRDMSRIEAAADRLRELLEDLHELSRLGHQPLRTEEIPLAELVQEARELIADEIRGRGVEVSVAADLPAITGDRTRLVELLQNLLHNAVRYMGDQVEPRVDVGVRRNGGGDVYFVRDNGIGIDPQYRDKVFGLFERLDASTDTVGVGLTLARRIVEIHDGRLWVESQGEGLGSTFCFTLSNSATDSPPSRRTASR